jgi:hypothetical protein
VILWGAVAIKAPFHALRFMLIDNLHLIDRAVARITTHATIHVHRMVEIRIVRHAVNLDPIDGGTVALAPVPSRSHRLQPGTLGFHLLVTGHAGLHRWHVGMRRHFHVAVAIPAIHPKLLNVEIVLKRHRLRGLIPDSGVLRGEIVGNAPGDGCPEYGNAHGQLPGKLIRPLWEEIGHQAGDLAVNCGDYRRIAGN